MSTFIKIHNWMMNSSASFVYMHEELKILNSAIEKLCKIGCIYHFIAYNQPVDSFLIQNQ